MEDIRLKLLEAILPSVLVDYFDIVKFEKTDKSYDIWMDEKNVLEEADAGNPDIISYGFREYYRIQDFPLRGRASYIHIRKRKWLDKSTGEIFCYGIDDIDEKGTRLSKEFVAFLKGEDR